LKEREKVQVKVKDVYYDKNLMIAYPSKKSSETLIIKGKFQNIYPGDNLYLFGHYEKNKMLGKYFEAEFYREVFDEFWLAKWLKVKKKFENRQIVKLVVDKKGIELVWDEFEMLKKTNSIFKFLLKHHVPEETIALIEQNYQWEWNKLIEDPYKLLQHADISYDHVQTIIQKFGCKNPISSRGKYFLENMLKKATNSGHFYLPKEYVAKELKEKGIDYNQLKLDERFVEISNMVFLKESYETEKSIAKNIQERLLLKKEEANEESVVRWENEHSFTLAINQKEAVMMALKEMFCVVTGGPGVGKTTVCKCITDLLGETKKIIMAAPTGRAAKRANESTGLPATTVHRLLEYDGEMFAKNKNNQIPGDVLVIDESSMIDAPLLLSLLEATPLTTKIIFVGDVDQLPSVGAGQILKDMIESGVVPVTRLTEIFRQAADSPIITLAYAVNSGELPDLVNHEDLTYSEYESEEEVFRETIRISENLYRHNDVFDVQILIPMYKGPVGIDMVNRELQRRLNPNMPSVSVGGFEIRENDKVIQTKNDYQRGIYNGDVGVATYVSDKKIKVRFQGSEKEVTYLPDNYRELQLSYAVTVHRSQGSEYKFAVIPTVASYGVMLQKNLLYTGITRAKKKCWMIYQMEALKHAASLESVAIRYTNLKNQLKNPA